VNYYEHHIGDYAAATAHLSLLEDAVYSRMLRRYYMQEAPLPSDWRQVARLVGARTDDELAAVQAVLAEFFSLRDDGYHQQRCDETLQAFQAGEPERLAKRANEEARLKKHRDERARLFSELNDRGITPAWNTNINELRRLHAGEDLKPATQTATATATPATATQTPDTTTHTPEKKKEKRQPKLALEFIVPDWIESDVWGAYLEVRSKKGAPATARAFGMVIVELIKLRDRGQDPNDVLRQSIRAGWTDVYPIKGAAMAASQDVRAPASKTGQAITKLEGMKSGNQRPDSEPHAALTLLGPGIPAGERAD